MPHHLHSLIRSPSSPPPSPALYCALKLSGEKHFTKGIKGSAPGQRNQTPEWDEELRFMLYPADAANPNEDGARTITTKGGDEITNTNIRGGSSSTSPASRPTLSSARRKST
ncbi:hypothetical protein DFH09DRAFT_1090163 [Mycena vulgaris]|nr:hypothetical protein DFH09DRAFT_1090163 [Mycena vulgaris]